MRRPVLPRDHRHVVKLDHLVAVIAEQFEEAHRGDAPSLVGIDSPNHIVEGLTHRVRLGRPSAAEEMKSGRVLSGPTADMIADDRLPAAQLGEEVALVEDVLHGPGVAHGCIL